MPSVDMIVAVTVAGLLLSASPGPSMLYVLSRSVGQSRSAGFASTIGLAIGGIILAIATALGLAAIFEYSPKAFTILQIAGGCYLCYLGYSLIRGAGNDDLSIRKVKDAAFSTILYQGILVEVLNPKTAIFFLAFLPQFIDYSRDDITTQVLVLGMLVPLTAVPSDVVVSMAGGTLAQKLKRNPLAGVILAWIAGLILIGLAVRIFFVSSPCCVAG
ncbi:MAG: LysE family translocator [Arenicellales bacterium]